jgi:hypothetical protein
MSPHCCAITRDARRVRIKREATKRAPTATAASAHHAGVNESWRRARNRSKLAP